LPPEPQIDPIIEMPNVVGERFDKAKAVLSEKGLSVSSSEKQTGERPPGTVIAQKPEPGTKMKKGDGVELVFAVKTILEQEPVPKAEGGPGSKGRVVVAAKPAAGKEQRRVMASKLAEEWFAAFSRKDVGGLVRIASIPFFFEHEVFSRIQDIETFYKNTFPELEMKSPGIWRLLEMKTQTIAEWKQEGFHVESDSVFRSMKLNDDDFMVRIVGEKGTNRLGISLYMRSVEGQLKVAGFWV
jgi:hypothetical protein